MKTFSTWFHFETDGVLYLFQALGVFDLAEFRDFVDQVSKEYLPVQVVVVFSNTSKKTIRPLSSEVRSLISGRFKRPPLLVVFRKRGDIVAFDEKIDSIKSFDESAFVSGGSAELLCRRNPIIDAPRGKMFVKPSGNKCSYFVHAGNTLVNHAEMTFAALLLIKLMRESLHKGLARIWVDTIDLYALVSLAFKVRFPRSRSLPVIESFSSYASFREAYRNGPCGNTLTVISATTSGNLERDIKSEFHDIDSKSIFTLLATSDAVAGRGLKAVFHLNPPGKGDLREDCPAIRIEGERFSIEAEEPKKVKLRKIKHGAILDKRRFSKIIDADVFSSFGHVGADYYPTYIDAEKLTSNLEFQKWFNKCLSLRLLQNARLLISADNDADKLVAMIEAKFDKATAVRFSDFNSEDIKDPVSVVVVASVISHGSVIRDISRRLREMGNVQNVTYVVGIATPPSKRDFSALRENVCMSKNHPEFPYEFFCFMLLETGRHTQAISSWLEEKQYLASRSEEGDLPSCFKNRLRDLEQLSLPTAKVFFEQKKLILTPGFVFMEAGYAGSPNADASALIATIFKVLQSARENEQLDDENLLYSSSHRQVLIDPENFFRFNDTMIQAALLRATHSCEMDYSDDEEASQCITYLVGRSLQLKSPVFYELMIALVTKRLKISKNEIKTIKESLDQPKVEEIGDQVEFFLGDEMWRSPTA